MVHAEVHLCIAKINHYTMRTLFLLGGLFILFSGIAQDKKADKKATRAEQFKEITALVQSRKFQFEATKAFPQGTGMRPVDLISNPNYTKLNDSIASAYMPFFGRAYVSGYGQDGGIEYNGKMDEVKISINEKKSSIRIEYRIKGEKDTYRVSIDAIYGGSATMNVISNNRSSISYDGEVTPLVVEEKSE
jgi:hypothetical protein